MKTSLFTRRTGEITRTRSDRIFDAVNTCIMILAVIVVIYPLYYCLILSFNDGQDTLREVSHCGRAFSRWTTTKRCLKKAQLYARSASRWRVR